MSEQDEAIEVLVQAARDAAETVAEAAQEAAIRVGASAADAAAVLTETRAATITALHRVADTMMMLTDTQRKSLETVRRIERMLEQGAQISREDKQELVALLNGLVTESRLLHQAFTTGIDETRRKIGGVSATVASVGKTVKKIDEQTDPRLKVVPDDEIPISRGISWVLIARFGGWAAPHVFRILLPAILSTAAGAVLLRDCAAQKPQPTIDGGR